MLGNGVVFVVIVVAVVEMMVLGVEVVAVVVGYLYRSCPTTPSPQPPPKNELN